MLTILPKQLFLRIQNWNWHTVKKKKKYTTFQFSYGYKERKFTTNTTKQQFEKTSVLLRHLICIKTQNKRVKGSAMTKWMLYCFINLITLINLPLPPQLQCPWADWHKSKIIWGTTRHSWTGKGGSTGIWKLLVYDYWYFKHTVTYVAELPCLFVQTF